MSLPKKVLILGSGGLRIGQAGEFDYSGSQAIKALKEEGVRTVLVNPNIATVQTDDTMADEVYLQPLNLTVVTRIIEKERPDALLLSFGGQTALNLGLSLARTGVLAKYNVPVLGTPIRAIELTEDRELFKQSLAEIGVCTARSRSVTTVADALLAAEEVGYPVMMRSGYSLGGLGSGRVDTAGQLRTRAAEALNGAPQILIEEYLAGWKEIEYEIMRDGADNAVIICNMENLDPMGIHTGESIVVAPSQTLTNKEYHSLREIALRVARHLGIVGECNIQYALDPKTGDYRVIEVNARLSRSSALASKATGYPLAFVAAKIALGKTLPELKNTVTQTTCAYFEPALDYLVVKMPRWDIQKLKSADRHIGSEMKSVGEVMAIGRSFPEALQKAVRMLGVGAGVGDTIHKFDNVEAEIRKATDRRLFAIYEYLRQGGSVADVQAMSHIDPWFLHQIDSIRQAAEAVGSEPLSTQKLLSLKKLGFSDRGIGNLTGRGEEDIRQQRIAANIRPWIKQIDTLAGEFRADTNYLYCTYHGAEHDVTPTKHRPTVVLGSGPYCIGSSVEFDWCAVNTARTLRSLGKQTLIINSNPETVSTDYDESDRLYFDELSLERVKDIADFEDPEGIIVSVGGQLANNLAIPLHKAGYPLLGTPAESIDRAENRKAFSSLLADLGIDQPVWTTATTLERAQDFAAEIGYPLLVRPSYVLSGAAMNVVASEEELGRYLTQATTLSPDYPVVISQFITNAKELEVDGVANAGEVVIEAMSEHIENAGVHSGDATIILPPQRLYLETIRRTKRITRQIVRALNITGPFNIQFLAKDNAIKVIECNVRSSRSFPFVSKVTNHNFIDIATKVLLGLPVPNNYQTLELDYVAVKSPQFSYSRLKGANPVANVEMASTGEVACIGDTLLEAFYLSWLATEQQVKGKRIFVSAGGSASKVKLLAGLLKLDEQGWEIYSTGGTSDYLARHGIASHFLYKVSDELEPNVATVLEERRVDLIINIPRHSSMRTRTDGYHIRRLAIDNHIPLITNLQIAQLFLQCLAEIQEDKIAIRSVREYMEGVLHNAHVHAELV